MRKRSLFASVALATSMALAMPASAGALPGLGIQAGEVSGSRSSSSGEGLFQLTQVGPSELQEALAVAEATWLKNNPGGTFPRVDMQELGVAFMPDGRVRLSSPSKEILQHLEQELRHSPLPRSLSPDGSISYDLEGGAVISINSDMGNGSSNFGPSIGAGVDGFGVYIAFNQTEQSMLLSGATTAIAALICAVAGPILCISAVIIAIGAAAWLSEHSRCHRDRPILRYYVNHPSRSRCVV